MKTGPIVFGIFLILLGGAANLFIAPRFGTDLATKGAQVTGQVQNKSAATLPDGSIVYTIGVVYQDEQQRNHMARVQVTDAGLYESLQERSEVRVWYMPNNPDQASIAGGSDMETPVGKMIRFLGWTAAGIGALMVVISLRALAKSEA